MINKNVMHNKLWNTDMLSLSVRVIKEFQVWIRSIAWIIVIRRLFATLSMLLLLRPVLLRSVIAVLMFLRDGAIRNRLKNFGVEDVQSALNQVLNDKVIETLPRRALTFAIDFVFIPFLWKRRERRRHN